MKSRAQVMAAAPLACRKSLPNGLPTRFFMRTHTLWTATGLNRRLPSRW